MRFRTPLGDLVFYPQSKRVTAFCVNPAHKDCRRSRSIEASDNAWRPGQGRPIGHLMAWLRLGQAIDTREAHVRFCHPSLADRRSGRREFNEIAGAAQFADCERRRREDEEEEPTDIA